MSTTSQIPRVLRITVPLLTIFMLSGCFPGMYHPYGHPMYTPPRTLNQGGAGSLIIPESSEPPYEPGTSTYDRDPEDDFDLDDNGRVPLPKDNDNSPFFEDDEDDLGTSLDSDFLGSGAVETAGFVAKEEVTIQPASHRIELSEVPEYGFDTANYSWIQGELRYDETRQFWAVLYSTARNDIYQGALPLRVSQELMEGLKDGMAVRVQGRVVNAVQGRESETAEYLVEDLRLVAAQ